MMKQPSFAIQLNVRCGLGLDAAFYGQLQAWEGQRGDCDFEILAMLLWRAWLDARFGVRPFQEIRSGRQ